MVENLRPGGNAGQSLPAEVLTLMDACRQGPLGDRNPCGAGVRRVRWNTFTAMPEVHR